MKERPHGTRAKYVWEKCRCFHCRLANTDYQTAREAALHRREPYRSVYVRMTNEWIVRHRETMEIIVRTSDKEEAHRVRDARNRDSARINQADMLWASKVEINRVRRHIRMLRDKGIGYKRIAALVGMSESRMLAIASGECHRKDRPTALRLRITTVQRILEIDPKPAPGARVDARDDCNRMIDEMLACGLTKTEIARRLGQKGNPPTLQISRRSVTVSTVAKVRKVHDDYWRENWRFRSICCCSWWDL